ncbi:MAG TPA: DNRLRE domain-containing protein [Thermoplasmatales archaeon]|nr:DNRLRE domain-containing protein [Thermoplasmatales archaeon]
MKKKMIGIFSVALLTSTVFTYLGTNDIYTRSVRADLSGVYNMYVWAESDAYIDSLGGMEGNENHGNEGCLKVAHELQVDYIYHAYTLLKFNLDEIPDDAVIKKAILWMSPIEWNIRSMEIRPLIESWEEDVVTWDNQPGTPPGPYIPIVNDPQMYLWNITGMFTSWWNGGLANHGLMIIPYDLDHYYSVAFHDRLDLNWTKWPRIEITYQGSPPPPWEPPESPDDFEEPSITITITPPDPGPTDIVNVVAEATDDVGLRYMKLTLTNPIMEKEWDTEEWLGETTNTLSFTQQFNMGVHFVEVLVRDVSGKSNGATDSFEVMGSNTTPQLNISCSPQEVWPDDNNTIINITVNVNDPEGIRYLQVGVENGFFSPDTWPNHGKIIYYTPPYPTSVEYTFAASNFQIPHRFNPLNRSYTEIICRAQVQDGEYLWSEIESCNVTVIRPYQWDYGLPFPNPSEDTLPWQRMYDIFGKEECCWGSKNQFHTNRARVTYNGYGKNKIGVKYICKNGECVGMSSYSLVYAIYEREIPNDFTYTGEEDFMRPWTTPFANARNSVKRSIERFQGAQYADAYHEKWYWQWLNTKGQRNPYDDFVSDIVPEIRNDIERGYQGYISFTEAKKWSSSGHAVVPWYVKEIIPGISYRIYVYDSNRDTASLFNESTPYIGSSAFNDYDNYELYPYIDINPTNMYFKWPDGNIWSGMIAYIPANVALQDDYRLPHGIEYFMVVG